MHGKEDNTQRQNGRYIPILPLRLFVRNQAETKEKRRPCDIGKSTENRSFDYRFSAGEKWQNCLIYWDGVINVMRRKTTEK